MLFRIVPSGEDPIKDCSPKTFRKFSRAPAPTKISYRNLGTTLQWILNLTNSSKPKTHKTMSRWEISKSVRSRASPFNTPLIEKTPVSPLVSAVTLRIIETVANIMVWRKSRFLWSSPRKSNSRGATVRDLSVLNCIVSVSTSKYSATSCVNVMVVRIVNKTKKKNKRQ